MNKIQTICKELRQSGFRSSVRYEKYYTDEHHPYYATYGLIFPIGTRVADLEHFFEYVYSARAESEIMVWRNGGVIEITEPKAT